MKNGVEELAIFGGTPAFVEQLHVGRPNIGNRELLLGRINDVLDKRWLTNGGPYVDELEKRIADFIGANHCIATCNGTMALEIAIRAVGMTGEVIVPAFTFVATAHALQWQGINPVFCDIDPKSHNIDPDRIEGLITRRTSGIIGVHLWGRPCKVEKLASIAKEHRLKLLFDAAHAFGCSHQGHMIGNFGNAEVFSFHATKSFNTFEGGAVVTNDDELAEKIRLMKNFGFAGYDHVICIGINGKMDEISAAMGLNGLESYDNFVTSNYRNYICYKNGLVELPGVQLITYDENEKCNFHYIVLEIDQEVAGITRDQLLSILHAENVLARRYFFPGCHRMEPYLSKFPNAGQLLEETEELTRRVLTLPTGTAIGPSEIHVICQIIRVSIIHAVEVKRRFGDKVGDKVNDGGVEIQKAN